LLLVNKFVACVIVQDVTIAMGGARCENTDHTD
jgi:hypothetical protein